MGSISPNLNQVPASNKPSRQIAKRQHINSHGGHADGIDFGQTLHLKHAFGRKTVIMQDIHHVHVVLIRQFHVVLVSVSLVPQISAHPNQIIIINLQIFNN